MKENPSDSPSMEVFQVIPPTTPIVPIVVSVPHAGITFPAEVKASFDQELIKEPDDTDWFVDQLYDFAPGLGITMIVANISRWVIDLNRNPEQAPLYDDGRIITGLVPHTTFAGQPLYTDDVQDESEISRRLEAFYQPYHSKVGDLLAGLKSEFPAVLLFDAHSIRQKVPTIHKEPFPDLILGDNDGKSAGRELVSTALEKLGSSHYQLEHNYPFKGGYITRSFGNPKSNIHALQLEMTKVNYMDDSELKYNDSRAKEVRQVLRSTLVALAEALQQF